MTPILGCLLLVPEVPREGLSGPKPRLGCKAVWRLKRRAKTLCFFHFVHQQHDLRIHFFIESLALSSGVPLVRKIGTFSYFGSRAFI